MNQLKEIVKSFNTQAVIFDLDGTLLDNNAYHLETWRKYLKKLGREMSDEEYKAHINGRTNRDAIEYIYGRKMQDEEANRYTEEKEALYREIYAPHIQPMPGLLKLLAEIESMGLPMAIATSGIKANINFMFEQIPMRKYFSIIVDSSSITKGKPDPEIYLQTAERLGVAPANCLVFEDAVVGIQSAKKAGMHVIAITTTHERKELLQADRVIDGYGELG